MLSVAWVVPLPLSPLGHPPFPHTPFGLPSSLRSARGSRRGRHYATTTRSANSDRFISEGGKRDYGHSTRMSGQGYLGHTYAQGGHHLSLRPTLLLVGSTAWPLSVRANPLGLTLSRVKSPPDLSHAQGLKDKKLRIS